MGLGQAARYGQHLAAATSDPSVFADRLRAPSSVLAEVEACAIRARSFEDTKTAILARCKDYLPLSSSTKQTGDLDAERRKDHYGHFVLRLAFCRSCVVPSARTYRHLFADVSTLVCPQ